MFWILEKLDGNILCQNTFCTCGIQKTPQKNYLNLELKSWEPHGPGCHQKDFFHHRLML